MVSTLYLEFSRVTEGCATEQDPATHSFPRLRVDAREGSLPHGTTRRAETGEMEQ